MGNAGWLGWLLLATSGFGQAVSRPGGTARDRVITFSITKPVIGLPLEGGRLQGLCSSDELSYFEPGSSTAGTARVLDLYSVTTTGETRHLTRSVPLEYTNVISRDFFPGDAALVTLIEAQKREGEGADARVRETQFYLYSSDHDGDGKTVVGLDLPFKPLKVGQFGSGEFLVLGWESGNELPKLVVLKEDGTLRRFIDLDERPDGTRPAKGEAATLGMLTGAAMVPHGGSVLLTYPGTSRPVRYLNGFGPGSTVTLEYPAGWELHDVLNSGTGRTLVARVREVGKASGLLRMLEFNAYTGRRIREFMFGDLPVSAVTCAAGRSLAAVFERAVGDSAGKEEKAMELVVGTVLK